MASSAVFCLSLQIRVESGNSQSVGGPQASIATISGQKVEHCQVSGAECIVKERRSDVILVKAPPGAHDSALLVANGGDSSSSSSSSAPSPRQHLLVMDRASAALVLNPRTAPEETPGTKPDGEPIKLPENLESLPKADHFPTQRHRWNTNEEIAAILISFERHNEWQSKEVKIRPKSGSMLLYSRKKVRYRRDGYCWKKRKDGKTTREDHMKLKVQGTECIYGCYVHSAILPTFHRRCYWLLQNPDIVLVHYLNVPYPDDNKLAVITPSLALWGDKKEWTKEELVSQLKPMFFSEDESDLNNELEISTAETVEAIVTQLMEKQRIARAAALTKQLECGCPDSTCADGKTCSHPMRRISAAKCVTSASDVGSTTNTRHVVNMSALNENNNQVSSTTGAGSMILSSSSNGNSGTVSSSSRRQEAISLHTRHGHSHHISTSSSANSPATSTPPLVLSLSQIQGGSGLLILNSSTSVSNTSGHQSLVSPVAVTSFVCSTNNTHHSVRNHLHSHHIKESTKNSSSVVLKQEAMETNSSNSCCHELSETKTSTSITTINVNNNNNNNNNSNNNNINSTNDMDITNGNITFNTGRTTYLSNGIGKSRKCPIKEDVSLADSSYIINSASSTPTKHMDTSSSDDILDIKPTFCTDDTVLVIGSASDSSVKSTESISLVGGFFNETLDLSQEDIQRTLSANLPLSCSDEITTNTRTNIISNGHIIASKTIVPSSCEEMSSEDVIVSEINPMDFIDGCDVVVSPTHVEDDVFVNLDAFDMLGDFPELEILEPTSDETSVHIVEASRHSRNSDIANSSGVEKGSENLSPRMDYREGTANITDYSPEWAYPEGGVKVLVTGPWYSTTSPYTVLFDTCPVATTLVQSGVLRCYCPAHEVGLATLQVACEGFVISNSVIFEYKKPPQEEHSQACETKVEKSNENLLKFTLLHRLEAVDERLHIKQEPEGIEMIESSSMFNQNSFEDRLVSYCQHMTLKSWKSEDDLMNVTSSANHRGMTLLHLAASLGYSRLVCTMLNWRSENSSAILENEVDALSQDDNGFTPLMWACAYGHRETAILLHRWNHIASNIRNSLSQNAVECARAEGHVDLAREMEELENDPLELVIFDKDGDSEQTVPTITAETDSMLDESRQNHKNHTLSSVEIITTLTPSLSPAESVVSLASVASTSRSHDGVFLRPGVVTRSESMKYKSSAGEFDSSLLDPSCDSIAWSPLSARDSSSTSPQPSMISSLNQKLSKRPSVDSGIHLGVFQSSDSLQSPRSRSARFGKENPRLSRFDRSMSLPLSSGMEVSDPLHTSPVRRMDYALCKNNKNCNLATTDGGSSPFIDVEAVSDEEMETKQDGAAVGEQEVRVLTLAEQIIAAIPERIKNESEDMILDSMSSPKSETVVMDPLSEVFMEPLLMDEQSSSFENNEFNFEFSDHNYRYYDVPSPTSSLSPASSSCLQSPGSFTLDSPSPPPTTADFCEFFQASNSLFEKDFSNLTLSDREQRELYEAAKIIQKAYRSYKGRKKLEEQEKERAAAILIQNYYRRYKQYAYFKQMTRAATVIQNGFRSYCENKRFKKSQEASVGSANYYCNYREQESRNSREPLSLTSGLKRTYSQRRQHQAARKIQQFMRQSKNKLQKERAEKEKLSDPSADAHQKLRCHDNSTVSCSIEQNNRNRIGKTDSQQKQFGKKLDK